MIRNFDTPILDLLTGTTLLANERMGLEKITIDGKDRYVVKDPLPLTLKVACITAIGNPLEKDKGISAENVAKLFGVVMKIRNGGDVELTIDEASLLNERVRAHFNILVSGQIADILSADPKPADPPAAV